MADPEIDDAAILGFYHPFYLFISTKFGLQEFLKPPSLLQKTWPLEKRLGYALSRYVSLHEIRHFHDFFGTMAGISLFHVHLRQVRAFAGFIETLRSAGEKLQLPLGSSWPDGDPIGEAAKGLVRNWAMLRKSTATFTQAFRRTTGKAHHPDDHVVYKKREGGNPDLPTFPLQYFVGPRENLRELTVYYPLGLEALVEGNTQALQRGLMEHEFPDGLADHLVPTGKHQEIPSSDPEEFVRLNALPYSVTDLLVSKYLRLRGHPKFQRTTILQLTDQALGESYIHAVSEPWEVPATFKMVDVGREFINRLERASISDLVKGTVPYPPSLTKMYQTFLDTISKSKKPEDIPYENDLLSPINMMEAVVTHHIIAPLLRVRLETKHEAFYSIMKYLEMLPKLPQVPVALEGENGEKEIHAGYMKSGFIGDAWTKYCLITHAMHEICGLGTGINCFRAQEIRNSKLNLCQKGTCTANIALGHCEEWFPAKPLPDCVFATMLRRFGLLD